MPDTAKSPTLRWTPAAIGYTVLVTVCGLGALAYQTVRWESSDVVLFALYVGMAAVASAMKVRLPGVTGTLSVSFLFILLGVAECSLPETLWIGFAATMVQLLWKAKRRPRLVQIAFNVASTSIAITCTFIPVRLLFTGLSAHSLPLLLLPSAAIYFLVNTLTVAGVIALTEGKGLPGVWKQCFLWSVPHYLVGASIAALVSSGNQFLGWQTSLAVLPIIYLIYRSFGVYMARLEEERKHAEKMAELHLRTIQALALAIEAKDETTHSHLERVQVYAMECGKDLGLSESELQALRAASILHDIGKLAVPEYIISKPGRLTAEEFEKMKVHPVVGAEILERIQFPYAVAPMVRSHHEKWNGQGYPDGLRGEEIPVGARILSVVDCLDALASERQYRRALPLDEAMEKVVAESGSSFDPAVVEVLRRRYKELERMAVATAEVCPKAPLDLRLNRNVTPAAGLEVSTETGSLRSPPAGEEDFLLSIAAARQEVQAVYDLHQHIGNSLSLLDTLSVLATRLKRFVPYDAIAIYLNRDNKLVPEYVGGENARLFDLLEIPIGEGLSGWVAENRKPMMNGNPSVEPGYLNDPAKFSTLRSALSVPLENSDGVLGVLSLYRSETDAFSGDQLRILLSISPKLTFAIENSIRFSRAESSAREDQLTGLPNARSLFLYLHRELARCKRHGLPLALIVCELDDFTAINDRLGHAAGDRTLQAVAKGLRGSCREYDYVARMGGDEFVVVMPDPDTDAPAALVARLAKVVSRVGRDANGVDLSASMGAACYPADGADEADLLTEADRRMYRAKKDKWRSRPIEASTSDGVPAAWARSG